MERQPVSGSDPGLVIGELNFRFTRKERIGIKENLDAGAGLQHNGIINANIDRHLDVSWIGDLHDPFTDGDGFADEFLPVGIDGHACTSGRDCSPIKHFSSEIEFCRFERVFGRG